MPAPVKVNSIEEMQSLVKTQMGKWGDQQLIVLSGKMGAGKTQWVQFVTEALGAKHVMSPTFAIHNSYESEQIQVDHVDLYRLEGDGDLESSGFWEMFDQEQGWIFVEWGDRLDQEYYPKNWPTTFVKIEKIEGEETARNVYIS